MLIKKKYYNMLLFASLFDKFSDGDEEIEIQNDNNIAIKYNEIKNGSLDDIVNKYDYDGDGIISFIDKEIIPGIILKEITSENDSLYDAENLTYNGKQINFDNDDKIIVSDFVGWENNVIWKLKNKIMFDNLYVPTIDDIDRNQAASLLFELALSLRQKDENGKYTTWPTLTELREAAIEKYGDKLSWT